MIDMGQIASAVTSLKLATDIAKGLMDLKTAAEIQNKVIELQAVILSAQSSALAAQSDQFSLLEQVRNLEGKIAELEAWNTEKERYELKDIGQGSMAYSIKPDMQGTEPPHHICANCYNQSKKRILQHTFLVVGRAETYACHDCGSTLYVSGQWDQAHQPRSGGGKRR